MKTKIFGGILACVVYFVSLVLMQIVMGCGNTADIHTTKQLLQIEQETQELAHIQKLLPRTATNLRVISNMYRGNTWYAWEFEGDCYISQGSMRNGIQATTHTKCDDNK